MLWLISICVLSAPSSEFCTSPLSSPPALPTAGLGPAGLLAWPHRLIPTLLNTVGLLGLGLLGLLPLEGLALFGMAPLLGLGWTLTLPKSTLLGSRAASVLGCSAPPLELGLGLELELELGLEVSLVTGTSPPSPSSL